MLFRLMVVMGLVGILAVQPVVAQDNFEVEIDNLAKTMAKSLKTLGKKKIAVVDFLDSEGNTTKFSRFLAEELSVSLSIADKSLSVYERTNINAIVKEQKLSTKASFEPAMAQKIGKLSSIEILVTGSYTVLTDSIRFRSKMTDTETGEFDAVRGSMALTPTFQRLLGSGSGFTEKNSNRLQPLETFNSGVGGAKKEVSVASTVVENIKFQVIKAQRSGSQLELTVVATNLKEDRYVAMYLSKNSYYPKTHIIDPEGKEYIPQEIKFGVSIMNNRNVQNNYFSIVQNMMAKGVPKQIVITFTNVSDTQVLTSLVLGAHVNDKDSRFRAKFKNIPISVL